MMPKTRKFQGGFESVSEQLRLARTDARLRLRKQEHQNRLNAKRKRAKKNHNGLGTTLTIKMHTPHPNAIGFTEKQFTIDTKKIAIYCNNIIGLYQHLNAQNTNNNNNNNNNVNCCVLNNHSMYWQLLFDLKAVRTITSHKNVPVNVLLQVLQHQHGSTFLVPVLGELLSVSSKAEKMKNVIENNNDMMWLNEMKRKEVFAYECSWILINLTSMRNDNHTGVHGCIDSNLNDYYLSLCKQHNLMHKIVDSTMHSDNIMLNASNLWIIGNLIGNGNEIKNFAVEVEFPFIVIMLRMTLSATTCNYSYITYYMCAYFKFKLI